jgi:hypothetical protein
MRRRRLRATLVLPGRRDLTVLAELGGVLRSRG